MCPWVRVENGAVLVNGIRAGCYFYLGPDWKHSMGRPKHWRFIAEMKLGTLMNYMEHGRLYLARKIRTEATK
jgi:hypothetical protein